jgi:hypothetical protein
MSGHNFTPQPGCTGLCVSDRLYLDLKGALERLCRAQTHMPAWWRADAQQAIVIVQMIGSAVCPDAWSKHDQPEYPEATS